MHTWTLAPLIHVKVFTTILRQAITEWVPTEPSGAKPSVDIVLDEKFDMLNATGFNESETLLQASDVIQYGR